MLSCRQLQAYMYRLARHASSFSLVCLHAQATHALDLRFLLSSYFFCESSLLRTKTTVPYKGACSTQVIFGFRVVVDVRTSSLIGLLLKLLTVVRLHASSATAPRSPARSTHTREVGR